MPLWSQPILLSRQKRQPGQAWAAARSWLGGQPKLGTQPWPRGGKKNLPLHFVAQLDLAQIARQRADTGLPAEGSLAFFVGGDGAVLYVPPGEAQSPSESPLDLPPPEDAGFDKAPAFWPIDFLRLDLAEPNEPDEEDVAYLASSAEVERHFVRREYNFTAKEAFATLADQPQPYWWHTAVLFAQQLDLALRRAPERTKSRQKDWEIARNSMQQLQPKGLLGTLRARFEAKSEGLQKAEKDLALRQQRIDEWSQQLANFGPFLHEVRAWVEGKNEWHSMSSQDVATLQQLFERARRDFKEVTRYHLSFSVEQLLTETLLVMAAGDDSIYRLLPESIRALINGKFRLPCGGWHQMFGKGVDIQGNAACDNEDCYMLLQLVHDDFLHWSFGDNGAYQFWITPSDLAQRNWSGVRLTFECH